MATEVAILPLREGRNLSDTASEAGQILEKILQILKQQKGFQRAYWGVEHENSNNFRFFVDWNSVEDHTAFRKKDYYQAFLDQFDKLIHSGQAHMFHAYLKPHPPSDALDKNSSPTTAILAIYFPADYSPADQQEFEEGWNKLITAVKQDSGSFTGYSGGWILEELTVPGTEEKSKAYAAYIGFQSVEAHLAYGETQSFRDNIHYLREAKGSRHLQVCHASLVMIEK